MRHSLSSETEDEGLSLFSLTFTVQPSLTTSPFGKTDNGGPPSLVWTRRRPTAQNTGTTRMLPGLIKRQASGPSAANTVGVGRIISVRTAVETSR